MPNPAGNLEARVEALEQEVRRLRQEAAVDRERTSVVAQDANAARVLAAGADHDVSEVRAELRAHTKVLNALGQSVAELRTEVREEIADVRQEMRSGFATLHIGMTRITELLTNLTAES